MLKRLRKSGDHTLCPHSHRPSGNNPHTSGPLVSRPAAPQVGLEMFLENVPESAASHNKPRNLMLHILDAITLAWKTSFSFF